MRLPWKVFRSSHVLIGLFVLLLLSCMGHLYILDISLLSEISSANLSPIQLVAIFFTECSFGSAEAFSLM